MTNINYCDTCRKRKGEENIKVIEFNPSQDSFHLNYCRDCFEKEFPEHDWDKVEDKREFMEQAKKKATEILSKKLGENFDILEDRFYDYLHGAIIGCKRDHINTTIQEMTKKILFSVYIDRLRSKTKFRKENIAILKDIFKSFDFDMPSDIIPELYDEMLENILEH